MATTTQNPPSGATTSPKAAKLTSAQAWDAANTAKADHKAAQKALHDFEKDNKKAIKSGTNQATTAQHTQLKQDVVNTKDILDDAKKDASKAVKRAGKAQGKPIAEKYLDKKEVDKVSKKALKAGEFRGSTFEGTYVGEKEKGLLSKSIGWITGSGTKTVTSRKLESKLGDLKLAERSLERTKSAGLSTEKLDQQILKLKTEIQDEAKKIFPQLFNAKSHHSEALSVFEEQRNKALSKSEKNFQEASKAHKGDKQNLNRLEAELQAEQKKINKMYDEASKEHKRFVEKASTLEGEIEHITGLKAADHVSTKALSNSLATLNEAETAKLKAGTGFSGMKKRVVHNVVEGGWKGKAKVGFGAAFAFDGLRRIKNAFIPGNGPDGQPQPMDLTQAIVGAVEGAGGIYAMQHGHSKA